MTDSQQIRVWRGKYENHTSGPYIAEIWTRDGMRHSERGHTEDEARERMQDALRRLR